MIFIRSRRQRRHDRRVYTAGLFREQRLKSEVLQSLVGVVVQEVLHILSEPQSIIELLSLGAGKGYEIEISATGDDAEAAVQALIDLVNNRFGEEC